MISIPRTEEASPDCVVERSGECWRLERPGRKGWVWMLLLVVVVVVGLALRHLKQKKAPESTDVVGVGLSRTIANRRTPVPENGNI